MTYCDCCGLRYPAEAVNQFGDRTICLDCEAVCGSDNQASPCRIAAAEEDTCEH